MSPAEKHSRLPLVTADTRCRQIKGYKCRMYKCYMQITCDYFLSTTLFLQVTCLEVQIGLLKQTTDFPGKRPEVDPGICYSKIVNAKFVTRNSSLIISLSSGVGRHRAYKPVWGMLCQTHTQTHRKYRSSVTVADAEQQLCNACLSVRLFDFLHLLSNELYQISTK